MGDIIKFALIGCGRIASKHIDAIEANKEEARLVAVCDIDESRARKVGEKLKLPYYTNYIDMIKNEDINVVSILTPSGTHAKIAIDVARLGKDLVVEKPMALRLEDADNMIKVCDEKSIKLFVVKQNRFNKAIQKLKEAIDKGRFGKMVLGTVRIRWTRRQDYYDMDPWRGKWEMDGGVFANQGSHHIDLLEWLLGDVESVMCKTATQLVNAETEDTGVAILRFRNGALGIIEVTTATRPRDLEGSISILGEKGSVIVGGFAVNQITTWEFEEKEPEDNEIIDKFKELPPNVYGFGHIEFIKDVIKSIKENKLGLIHGLEGRKSIELINALYESAETGKEVYLYFVPKKSKLGRNKYD